MIGAISACCSGSLGRTTTTRDLGWLTRNRVRDVYLTQRRRRGSGPVGQGHRWLPSRRCRRDPIPRETPSRPGAPRSSTITDRGIEQSNREPQPLRQSRVKNPTACLAHCPAPRPPPRRRRRLGRSDDNHRASEPALPTSNVRAPSPSFHLNIVSTALTTRARTSTGELRISAVR